MLARIYRPAKTAMQSGKAKTLEWVLEFEPASARLPDPLMGWAQSKDMNGQVRLSFSTREEAIAYAQAQRLTYEVWEPNKRRLVHKAYADNFKFSKVNG